MRLPCTSWVTFNAPFRVYAVLFKFRLQGTEQVNPSFRLMIYRVSQALKYIEARFTFRHFDELSDRGIVKSFC